MSGVANNATTWSRKAHADAPGSSKQPDGAHGHCIANENYSQYNGVTRSRSAGLTLLPGVVNLDSPTALALPPLQTKLLALLDEVLAHDGFGSVRVDVRLLKRGQKEVILDCGKQHRFVVDIPVLAPR